VVYYEAERIKALYAAAKNGEEPFTVDYFLKSGVRWRSRSGRIQ
jgi:hypothetical protein